LLPSPVGTPPIPAAGGDFAGPPPESEPPAAWPAIEGYELLHELGKGGMGVVYQARQLGLNRLVALKMIRAGAHARPEDLRRFRTEAEAVAHLQHPNIIEIYEIGEQDGQPYFSLELAQSGSLAQRLNGTPLPARIAAQLTEPLARAVHYAHQRGIIHRDLKPANILLQESGIRQGSGIRQAGFSCFSDS
jgi:serine/threonine-protein kinase